MDLEKVKSSAIQGASEGEASEEELKKNIALTMRSLYKLMDIFNEGWKTKMAAFVEEFLTKCTEILKQNEFTVTRTAKSEVVAAGTILSADYQGAKVEITNINYDSQPMYLSSGKEEPVRFLIGTPKEVPNYYLWKDYVDICGTKLCKLEHDAEAVYNHFVDETTCIDELYVIQDEIDGNMNHYKRGILDIEFIQLVIYNEDKSIQFSNFQEFWDAL